MFMKVDFVKKMVVVKKSSKHGQYGSFGHLIFLSVTVMVDFVKMVVLKKSSKHGQYGSFEHLFLL